VKAKICAESLKDIDSLFSSKKWSGYVNIIFEKGEAGRGSIIFRDGKMVGCLYECKDSTPIFGDKSLTLLEGLFSKTKDAFLDIKATIYMCNKGDILDFLNIVPEARIGAKTSTGEAVTTLFSSVAMTGLDRKKLLKKYRIKEPTDREIDEILKSTYTVRGIENDNRL
jgi:hypothetical protein